MRVLKGIFAVILFLISIMIFIGMLGVTADKYNEGSLVTAEMFAPLIFTGGICLIALGEFIRIIRKKKWIFLPMIYMNGVMLFAAVSVGEFAYYAAGKGSGYLAAGIVMTVLTLLLILAAFGFRAGTKHAATPLSSFGREDKYKLFSAQNCIEDVTEEYCRMNSIEFEDETAEADFFEEMTDKFCIYGCGVISYLYVWLMKKGFIYDDFRGQVVRDDDILNGRGDAAEIIYRKHEGRLYRSDIAHDALPFMDFYYERVSRVCRSDSSYCHDYTDIVMKNSDVIYCRDFSWYICKLMEERIEQRYIEYTRRTALEHCETGSRKFYSPAFGQEFSLSTEVVPEGERESFGAYVRRCIETLGDFPKPILDNIVYEASKVWGGVSLEERLTAEEFVQQLSSAEMIVPKPYGDELAFILAFEAKFETEHGVAFVIRDGRVLEACYRIDAESPWCLD